MNELDRANDFIARLKNISEKPSNKVRYSLNYTPSQKAALERLADWIDIKDRDNLFYTLSGAAGTGKTTIIKDLIGYARTRGTIAVTATTHKAVHVISNIVGVKGLTIQKLCGLRPNTNLENFDINRIPFDPLGRAYISDYNLVIVDESSQLNKGVMTHIQSLASQSGNKVLYVGDNFQLPPVGEKYSKVFENKNLIELTEIVRQEAGNPLLELLAVTREDVKRNTSRFISYLHGRKERENDKGEGYHCYDNITFSKICISLFGSDTFTKNVNHCRYTAYTNDNILQWNSYIRKSIYPNVTRVVDEDDLLISYNTILDEFNSPIITNSSDYSIEEIVPYTNTYGIDGFLTRLKDANDGRDTPYIFIVDHTNPVAFGRFMTNFNGLIELAKSAKPQNRSRAWKDYFAFKEKNLLLTNIVESGSLVVGKDLDYGYGITTHKTQGSTYNNILINVNDMIYTKWGELYKDTSLRNRLIYVALSRAKHKAIILL